MLPTGPAASYQEISGSFWSIIVVALTYAATIAAGGTLRADDNPETLQKRLEVYYRSTAPLLGYYSGQGKLKTLDGMAPIGDVTAQIASILNSL